MENIPSEDIRLKLEEYYEAFHNKEWLKFSECLADNFKYFTDNTFTLDKSNYVNFLKEDPWQGVEYKISDLEIRVSREGDMGFAVYKTFFKGLVRNKIQTVNAIETTIFIKENDWKIIHTHTSNKG